MSQRDEKKKGSEHDALAVLCSKLPLTDIASVESGEAPDFIITLRSARTIGVEIVSLLRDVGAAGSPLRRKEAMEDRVLAEARAQWEKGARPCVDARAHFLGHAPITGADVPRLASGLVGIATALLPDEDLKMRSFSVGEIDIWHMPPGEGKDALLHFAAHIDHVSVLRAAVLQRSHWYPQRADYMPVCTREDLQRAIDSHDGKASRYRSRGVNEVWLVVDADGTAPSSFWRFEGALDDAYVAAFDRVFVVQKLPTVLSELRLLRPAPGVAPTEGVQGSR